MIGVVGEVVCAHPQLIARLGELQLEVEHSVGSIFYDVAGRLCIDILDIAAQTVLPTQIPRCRLRFACRQRGDRQMLPAKANREAIATPAGNSKLRHNLDKDRNAN